MDIFKAGETAYVWTAEIRGWHRLLAAVDTSDAPMGTDPNIDPPDDPTDPQAIRARKKRDVKAETLMVVEGDITVYFSKHGMEYDTDIYPCVYKTDFAGNGPVEREINWSAVPRGETVLVKDKVHKPFVERIFAAKHNNGFHCHPSDGGRMKKWRYARFPSSFVIPEAWYEQG